jgi:multidrug resistance efflux pump
LLAFWILGLAALVISAGGAFFALHSPASPHTGTKNSQAAASDPGPVLYGYVDVESGVTPLYSLQPGRVVEVPAKENAKVEKDQVLVRVDDRLARRQLAEAKADLAAAEAQLAQAKKIPEQHALKVKQQESAIKTLQAKLEAGRLEAQDKQKRADSKVGGINDLQAKAFAREVESLVPTIQAEQDKLEELKLVDPEMQVRRAQAEVDARKAKADQAQLAVDECVVKAPEAGYVLQVLVSPGTVLTTQPTQPAVQFWPASKKRIVRAEVEQEFAGRVRNGQAVTVEEESGRNNRWDGKVERLAKWYTQRRVGQSDTMRIGNSDVHVLECIVELAVDPASEAPRIGQRVRVRVQ